MLSGVHFKFCCWFDSMWKCWQIGDFDRLFVFLIWLSKALKLRRLYFVFFLFIYCANLWMKESNCLWIWNYFWREKKKEITILQLTARKCWQISWKKSMHVFWSTKKQQWKITELSEWGLKVEKKTGEQTERMKFFGWCVFINRNACGLFTINLIDIFHIFEWWLQVQCLKSVIWTGIQKYR